MAEEERKHIAYAEMLDAQGRAQIVAKAEADKRDKKFLAELRGIHETLQTIRSWIVFGGIVLLLAIGLAACNAIMRLPIAAFR